MGGRLPACLLLDVAVAAGRLLLRHRVVPEEPVDGILGSVERLPVSIDDRLIRTGGQQQDDQSPWDLLESAHFDLPNDNPAVSLRRGNLALQDRSLGKGRV